MRSQIQNNKLQLPSRLSLHTVALVVGATGILIYSINRIIGGGSLNWVFVSGLVLFMTALVVRIPFAQVLASLLQSADAKLFREHVPNPAKLYVCSVIFVGFSIACYSLFQAFLNTHLQWLALAALTAIVACFPVRIPLLKGQKQSLSISMGDVCVFTAILLFGPNIAVAIGLVEAGVTTGRVKVRGYKRFFNLAQLAVVSFVVGHVFYRLHGTQPPLDRNLVEDPARLLVETGVCGLVYFVLNTGLVGKAVSLCTDKPFWEVWRVNFIWASITHFAGACLGAVMFICFKTIQFYSIAVAIPIIVLVYYAYRMNQDRIQRTQDYLDEVRLILAEKLEAEKELQKAKDGLELRVQARTSELRTANQLLQVEVNERKQAEERLAVTLTSIGDGVITTDTEGRVVLVNRVAEEITGWTHDEASGRRLSEVFCVFQHPSGESGENPAEVVLRTGKTFKHQAKGDVIRARDGSEIGISNSAAPILDDKGKMLGVVLVFRDITAQLRMEEELTKGQKMESLGVLAGGIAHDFNNILSGVLLKAQLAQRAMRRGKDPSGFLGSIEDATQTATGLTQQLLTFAKGGAPIRSTVSVKQLVEESATFALRGSKTICEFDIPDDLWAAHVDTGQIGQVINNLIINAEEAMPDGGTISIRADNVQIAPSARVAGLEPGAYVKTSVTDGGSGISQDDLPRIFDPYFTKKARGSGLGLTSTYSIIKRHQGQITVESEPDSGTTFTFYLPASSEPVVEKEARQQALFSGGGRVLVMDDEAIIRESLGELLAELGYEAEFAGDGREALAKYKNAFSSGRPFDSVIMDLTIPGGMGGKEVIKELLVFDPEVTAIVSSGYSKDPVMANYQQYGFSAVLAKPLRLEEVARVINMTVNSAASRNLSLSA